MVVGVELHKQAGLILATGKRIRDYMTRVQTRIIAEDPALNGLAEMTMQQVSVAMVTMDRGALTVTELSRMLGVSVPSMSAMIDRLVEKDVLAREHSEEDRRKVVVTIAPAARRNLARLQDGMQAAITHLTDRLGPQATLQWYDVMLKINAILADQEREDSSP